MNSADQLRQEASEHLQKAQDSFDRSDTDGCLSQWAHGISAQQKQAKAKLIEAGGLSDFTGLYEGDRRVAAKTISKSFSGHTSYSWLLNDAEAARFGRRFIPCGKNSKIQRDLGLAERKEMAPAYVTTGGGGKGLAGAASVRVMVLRSTRDDEWGMKARLMTAAELEARNA